MRPINLQEPETPKKGILAFSKSPVWMLAFRPFFLMGAMLALVSVGYWLLILTGYTAWQLTIPATLWHAHEMLFGFAGVVAVGFLLTAAQTWTGVPSISGTPLIWLTFIWLAARFCFFILVPDFANLNLYLVMMLQLIWWLGAIATLANMLFKAKNKNNYPLLAVLVVLCALNTFYLALILNHDLQYALATVDTAVLIMTLLIGIVAGRVIPFFTAKGLQLAKQVSTPKIDIALLYSSILAIALFFISKLFLNDINPALGFTLVAVLHLIRSYFWWNKGVLNVPLLWSLHISYFTLSVGLFLVALSLSSELIPFQDALHLITIGTIGMMILAMMTRVSHGHTGRPLVIPHFMAVAFALVMVAGIIRSLFPLFIESYLAWQLSAVLWLVAFLLFLIHCIPILTRPRIDGRRG
ncbi:NnrS family protein [Aliiglaciecola sp. NS0011-25]|uniref:NnrS family protein n=1 Tax=Aliiglaciecola sp. NS0011-25 TaxID=3127654 RepID=UPI00310A72BA